MLSSKIKNLLIKIYRKLDPCVCSKCGTPKCVGKEQTYCPSCEKPK